MRIPGSAIALWFGIRLKDWVMGPRESEDAPTVLYDRTLLWLTLGLAIGGLCHGDLRFDACRAA
jgi:cell division-specific peptidoglycan biosynthesis regulator FtsW